jgi:hypothetical protein
LQERRSIVHKTLPPCIFRAQVGLQRYLAKLRDQSLIGSRLLVRFILLDTRLHDSTKHAMSRCQG